MIQILENSTPSFEEKQYFIWQDVEWQKFRAIQASFADLPGVKLAYCEGVLEIMGVGKEHEAIKCLLALLLGQYFLVRQIEFFPSGSFNQTLEGVVDYQADLSYSFGENKEVPDLCVEIVFTSGSPIKLRKYQLLGVPEVWFWEDGTLAIYRWQGEGYESVEESRLLPGLNLELLKRCLLFASPLEAMREFTQNL